MVHLGTTTEKFIIFFWLVNNSSPIMGVICNPIEKLTSKYDHVFKESIPVKSRDNECTAIYKISIRKTTDTKSMGAQVQYLPHSQWCNYVPISFALPVCLSVPQPAYLLAGTNMRNGE
jgi:hypothetical protein